ncbi:3-dehydroquinate synthase [Arachis hypogaea]|nr:3-dehydroquinate synthase [Arachis hypogaea]
MASVCCFTSSLVPLHRPIHQFSSFLTIPNNKNTSATASAIVPSTSMKNSKTVWIWTTTQHVMTSALERGWNTFLFSSPHQNLAHHWSSVAVIFPLFVGEGEILDGQGKRVASVIDVSTPEELERLRPEDEQSENIVVNLLDWQVIPAENIIAAFHNSQKRVFAISNSTSEAKIFLEALEHGLDGIVLKVEDVEHVLELRYLHTGELGTVRNILTKSRRKQSTELDQSHRDTHSGGWNGDRVCVDLCSLMKPGEGLMVGSFARGLFLVHSECLESNYIASRPFRVNAGPVHAYVAVPGGRTCYLSELKSGKEVIVVDQQGRQRVAIVGRVKIETRPLILVEAKRDSDSQTVSILLQNAETVALICPPQGEALSKTAVPVTSLKVGDEILLRVQGGARHTGIEIQEFIGRN